MSPASPLAVVIDDEEDIRRVARLALRVDGWRVEVASDGRNGFELVRQHRPQLILVDLMMPSMSGAEFCRKVVEELGMQDVPIMMVSGVSEKAKILDDFWALPLRRRSFLKKPFDAAELIRAVQQLLPAEARHAGGASAASAPSSGKTSRPAADSHAPTPPPWLSLDRDKQKPIASTSPPPDAPRPAASGPAPGKLSGAAPGLPKAGAAPKPAAGGPVDDHLRGYRILHIDDDPDILTIMKMHLSNYHEVANAENGMQGLKAMESFMPDFVITDINMPVMNGLETAEAIRRHPKFNEVPIFFVTAETDTNLPRKAFELGGNLYLRKPLDPTRLIKCLDFFLRETGLPPCRYLNEQRKAEETGGRPRPGVANRVRVLVVDFNIENHRLLKNLLGETGRQGKVTAGGALEIFWTEDPRAALGNLNRWEPDLVLYNPRNPNLDAVGFGQMLKLNHELEKTRVWLIGTRFYDADLRYSQQTFGHEVVNLEAPEKVLIEQLGRAAAESAASIRSKQFAWDQLNTEEVERLRQLQQSDARKARERDLLRKRYSSVQEFIDRTLS
jgi:CheY-like chemotaxis protein